MLPYELTGISAETEKDAAKKAKLIIAKCGYFPEQMSIEDKIKTLSVEWVGSDN